MKLKHKIFFIIAALFALTSWAIAIFYWDKLPGTIPIYFGINGQADDWANKSFFYFYLIPILQTMMLGAFVFLYYKPQYSDMPTTMWLMTLDKKHRDHAFSLIRTMLVGMALWIGALLTYITYGMNASALDSNLGLSPVLLLTLIGLMIIWLIYWTFKVFKATKSAIASRHID